MRIVTITPAGGLEFVIFDETKAHLPDACADGFTLRRVRSIQREDLSRSATQFMADRFNAAAEWTFQVLYTFDDAQTCQDFVSDRPFLLPGSGLVMIHTETPSGAFQRYNANAMLDQADCIRDIGVTTIFRYRLLFQNPFSESPA